MKYHRKQVIRFLGRKSQVGHSLCSVAEEELEEEDGASAAHGQSAAGTAAAPACVRLLPDVEAAEREVSSQRSPASLPSSPARAAEANAQVGSAFSYGEKWSKMRHIPVLSAALQLPATSRCSLVV